MSVFLCGLLAGLAACSRAPEVPAPAAIADPWPAFAARFIEDYLEANPFFAVQAGRHEFDGQMPDLSAAGIAREVARVKAVRYQAESIPDERLTAAERFERDYVLSIIGTELFWLDRARAPFTNPAWYIDQLDPDVYLNRAYAPPATRMRAFIAYARAIPAIAADVRANLRTPLPQSFLERGISGFGGYANFFRNEVGAVFADVPDARAQAELAQADEAAARAMDGLRSWLQGERGRATQNFAMGEPLFLAMLRSTEDVEIPVAQLLAAGRADLERNTQALQAACARYLPRGTLAACVARMSAHKPQGGAVAGARAQLAQLRQFVIDHHVADVPSDEVCQVAEAPPYNRANGAYINTPGPYDRGVAYTFYIAPPDPSWSARERAAYIPGSASLLYTSVHEVWPGHFLQFLHSNRNPSRIAALWVGYAYAEGWAHYAEEMMWDEGLGAGDPQQHVGQIAEALLRDVRYLSAIGMHTRGMSIAESERMFRDRAFYDAGNARQQAARGSYDPEYLKYTLGKLMIRKLRADWIARQPGGVADPDPRRLWYQFHNQFLSYGGPPIPLVRRAMLGEVGALL
ncbi:MAG: DUF885 domain-containing protein [Proteobacteria bacterium]|nr:DUF885 domain-containing protein [Pseudomonadota bacterium]